MIRSKKLLAMILIFTMTFSNFAFVTKSIATTSFVSIFGSNFTDENIEFEAYLSCAKEESNVMISDVNNEDLSIKLKLDVKNSGYLKNGKVEIKSNEKEDLNFEIKEDNTIAELEDVQSLKENVLTLNKLESSSNKLELNIPIEYKNEEFINESKLCNTAKVVLSGIYVDNKGEEKEVSKEIELTLAWKDERTISVESEVSKYIQYGSNGIILQTLIKVDGSNPEKNSLPVKQTELNVEVPKINDRTPSEVTVVANSTLGTNGKNVGEVEFNHDNWNYDREENKITIKTQNNKQLVEINKSEEYLKEENKEIKKEERYYSVAGTDEYLVTYIYKNANITEKMDISLKLEANVSIFNGIQSSGNVSIVSSEKNNEYTLAEQTGNIISYNIDNETKEVSKIYGYLKNDNSEIEFDSKTAINISYKDIVEEILIEDVQNYYIDKSDNKIETEDMYYKQISINKENFDEILGEDGNLQILDVSGNELVNVNKEYNVDENGNYVVNFENRYSKLIIKTSGPINTGNLIISNKKVITNVSMEKSEYSNIQYIAVDTIQKAKFNDISDFVEVGNCTIKTELKDTATDFNLIIDKESLSTVTPNTNVEMRLELNNDKETSDIYGNTIFEIEMPECITDLNITNANMIYGEGLNISNVETYVKDDKTIIRTTIEGKQEKINSGVLTNGTNIVINADINVDMYTPSLDKTVKAYCYNEEATNYTNAVQYTINESTVNQYDEEQISYVAPSGLFAVNSISNYDKSGETISSIKQGKKVGYIDIYSEIINPKMEIVVVNNNENLVGNIQILGRIPSKGVKDIVTEDDLGSTIDTKLITGIVSNEQNDGEFTVYYSENENATKDLNDLSNGWVINPENLANMKSYLIVPNDDNYKLDSKQTLKFTYDYQVPENLEHNENIFGTFAVYYTNSTDIAITDEIAVPDLVGLTTGEGPELDLNIESETKSVKSLDKINTTITLKNTGKDTVNDINVTVPVPTYTTYVSSYVDRTEATTELVENKVLAKIDKLEKNTELKLDVTFMVDDVFDIENDETILIMANVSAKDLKKELTAMLDEISIQTSDLSINQFMDNGISDSTFKKDDEINIALCAINLTEKNKNDVIVETQLPKELNFVEAYMVSGSSEEGIEKIENATYDSSTNKITWNIEKIEAEQSVSLKLNVKVGNLETGVTANTSKISTKIWAEGTEKYSAKDIEIKLGNSNISVIQTSKTATYVTEGDTIVYTFTIKNEGKTETNNFVLTDIIPDGVIVRKISYTVNGEEYVERVSETEIAEIELSIPAEAQVDVNVYATALGLNETLEKTVTNSATVSDANMKDEKVNSVTHIIKAKESSEVEEKSENQSNFENTENIESVNNDITKSYKITGTAWLDSNSNGMRDDNENKMSNITAMLVDSNSGVIKSTMTTDGKGEYTFSGVQNGSYLVLFKYDTVLYTPTTYRKDGVATNVNSDVVTTKIELDGRKENGAVTDVISVSGANVSNIDIGLVEAEQFSLQLDKSISKVTVQNSQGTKTENFDNTKLAKYDIAGKYLSGTKVYIEYTLKVINNGDLSGFASEIVDYIPQGLTFNSNLNPDWYTGTDGNLYTKALANTEIAKGESREIKLVLTKQMTAENTGNVSNTAEIADDYNIYGVSDKNSTPMNKAQGEDDMSTADTILTVKTGESLIYVSAIIISLLIGSAIVFIGYKVVVKRKMKGGV